jgi:hypothetical protein
MDRATNEGTKMAEQAIGVHFEMFNFAGVIVHLFMDAHLDGKEEGRIIVKNYDGETTEYLTYSGQSDKMDSMAKALESAAKNVKEMK